MIAKPTTAGLELWGGVECTVNRVGNTFHDQLERSGHARHPEDLDRFAALGLTVLRYPVLWERLPPQGLDRADWSWTDERLERLRSLGLTPIAGLLHHGSGPPTTNLLAPDFPTRLASYAGAVARRYPWINSYTPVNEPLTTARFSALYGHWYPHARDGRSFLRALINQCRAVALSMAAIREVTPTARLVQTEDLGKTFSTGRLTYQAEFENERRWLSFDLLCGRVDRDHALWPWLRRQGISEAELAWFLDHPCPPDTFGLNYYLTSERFLDDRLEHYPTSTHGGNGRDRYADVEAVRVRDEGISGPRALLLEVWERYHRPLAVTEVHNGCTREEQVRWLMEVWDAAQGLRRIGVQVQAVTAWALLGTFDWNSLVTRADGHYEPGAFDVRAPVPRATAIARTLRQLSAGRRPDHPVLDTAGWWRRSRRFAFGARSARPSVPRDDERRLLIVGARGSLGQALAHQCEVRGLRYVALDRAALDVTDAGAVEAVLQRHLPWAVVNASGYVRVDDAEREVACCHEINADGPAILTGACRSLGIQLVTYSSDLVFDGQTSQPYTEVSSPEPLNVYGASKLEGERRALAADPRALVIRTSAFFGPWDAHNFVTRGLRELASGEPWLAQDDAVVSPTYLPDLADCSLDLLIDGEAGLWHLANRGAVTWVELARRAAALAGLDPCRVYAVAGPVPGQRAARPRYSALGSVRGWPMPSLDSALTRYADALEQHGVLTADHPRDPHHEPSGRAVRLQVQAESAN
jgi:dTDP-4-dehydrorhamnose reductase